MGAAADFFTGGRALSGQCPSLHRENKGSSSYRQKAMRTDTVSSLGKGSVMGRDSIQGFLRFAGDVHVLKRELCISRKHRVLVPDLLLVLTARHSSFSMSWPSS